MHTYQVWFGMASPVLEILLLFKNGQNSPSKMLRCKEGKELSLPSSLPPSLPPFFPPSLSRHILPASN